MFGKNHAMCGQQIQQHLVSWTSGTLLQQCDAWLAKFATLGQLAKFATLGQLDCRHTITAIQ